MSTIHHDTCPVCGNSGLEKVAQIKDHSVSGSEFHVHQCPNCALRLTQDQPDAQHIAPYYASEDYISHSDSNQGLINRLYHIVRKRMLTQKSALISKFKDSGKLLDIGAGTGYFLAQMRDQGWEVTGLEPDPGARAVAKQQFDLEIDHTDNLHGLPDASFDVITMWHVLEHVHTLPEYMATLQRVLADDGVLVIAVPNYTSYDARFYHATWAAYDVPRHLWHFAPQTMRTLLKRSGFDLKDQRTMPFDAYYVSLLSEKYRNNKLGMVRAPIVGTLSNIKAMMNKDRASSIIYIARKSPDA